MTPRRLTAALLAAGTLALGGTTVAFASTPGNSGNPHHRHNCVSPQPTGAPGKQCDQKPKPKHTPHATPTPKPKHKPHPKHPTHPTHPTHPPKP